MVSLSHGSDPIAVVGAVADQTVHDVQPKSVRNKGEEIAMRVALTFAICAAIIMAVFLLCIKIQPIIKFYVGQFITAVRTVFWALSLLRSFPEPGSGRRFGVRPWRFRSRLSARRASSAPSTEMSYI